MSSTLYRKYRPQTFAEVISQEHIKLTLQNEILAGRLSHAYLFCGPRGIGKTTMARLLAKAANCHSLKGFEPCGECPSCLEIADGRSMDLVEIDAASSRGINEIKELREQAKYTPVKEKFKVFIIDEVHMLTDPAFNALLKTLEEPPAYVIFVLATTEIHKIPETIISRCQRFDYKKIPFLQMVDHLTELAGKENKKISREVLENIARISGGYSRDALSLLGQILTLGDEEITLEMAATVLPRSDVAAASYLIELLLQNKTAEALKNVINLIDNGIDPDYFLKFFTAIFRQILLAKVTDNWRGLQFELGESYQNIAAEKWQNVVQEKIISVLDFCFEAIESSKHSIIPQLPLEVCLIKIGELLNAKNNVVEFKSAPLKESETKPEKKDDQDKNNFPQSGAGGSKNIQETEQLPIIDITENENGEVLQKEIDPALDFSVLLSRWQEVIETVKNHNYSLAAFLQAGKPLRLEGRILILGFQFSFHFERIKERSNAQIIKGILADLFGVNLELSGEISDIHAKNILNSERKAEAAIASVDNILETLGGEVVG